MSIEERIEEIEQDQSPDLKEIYRLAEQAEQVQPLLLPEARRYNNYIDSFKQADSEETDFEGYAAISENMLAHESAYIVDLVERHEALLEDIREAVDKLTYCSDNRYIDGTVVRKEKLLDRMEELIDVYEEDLDGVMEICSRTVPDENIIDPFKIKSKRSQREAQRESEPESLLTGSNIVEGFFAD